MTKNLQILLDKNEKVFELSIMGFPIHEGFKIILENLCQNYYTTYFYDISTYVYEFHEGINHITNTIELHNNMNENYKTNEYKTDNQEFYNNVIYIEKLDEFLTISRSFLKYISNSFETFSLGSANIVEISRCEENMELILTSIGYKEKSKVRKTGEFIKYKNESIAVFLCNVEKLSMTEANGVNETSTNYTNQPTLQKKLPMMLEIVGYCYETEKDKMTELLNTIQKQLIGYFVFEGDFKKV
jgi:hypothetical protein